MSAPSSLHFLNDMMRQLVSSTYRIVTKIQLHWPFNSEAPVCMFSLILKFDLLDNIISRAWWNLSEKILYFRPWSILLCDIQHPIQAHQTLLYVTVSPKYFDLTTISTIVMGEKNYKFWNLANSMTEVWLISPKNLIFCTRLLKNNR